MPGHPACQWDECVNGVREFLTYGMRGPALEPKPQRAMKESLPGALPPPR